jgi:hypothetical protein
MSRILIFLLLLTSLHTATAQETTKQLLKKKINRFFDALHKGDSTKMSQLLHKDIKIQTTATNRDGEKLLRTETREQLLTSVANKKPEDTYEEKLLSYHVKVDGNLASIWTPYEFYYNGNFSHCGANSFQMFNNNGNWQIIYLVDMRRRDGCKDSKDKK